FLCTTLFRSVGLPDRRLLQEAERADVGRAGGFRVTVQVLRDPLVELVLPVAPLVEVGLPAVRDVHERREEILGQRALRRPLLLHAKRPAPGQNRHDRHERDTLHASNHIRADSRTMPRSIARATWARSRLASAGTSSLSASLRRTPLQLRVALST